MLTTLSSHLVGHSYLKCPSRRRRLPGARCSTFGVYCAMAGTVPRPTALWAYRAFGGIIPLEVWLPFARGGWLLVAFVIALSTLTQRRLFASWWILPAVIVAVMLAHVATLSSHRFAVPILPLVFVMISGPFYSAITIALHWITLRRWRIALAFLSVMVALGLQRESPGLNVRYAAADLDTMNEVNQVDPILGRSVRITPAAGGRRTAMILSDEYLPAGDVRLRIRARRGHSTAGIDTPVARVTFISSDGAPGCAEDLPLGSFVTDRFADIWLFCKLPSEGPATLIVDVLGVVDLAFDDIRMTWLPVSSRDRGTQTASSSVLSAELVPTPSGHDHDNFVRGHAQPTRSPHGCGRNTAREERPRQTASHCQRETCRGYCVRIRCQPAPGNASRRPDRATSTRPAGRRLRA